VTARTIAAVLLASAGALAPLSARAEAQGRPILESRLRYETVSQDGPVKDAQALTLRTRMGYESEAWRGFRVLVEGENVVALVEDYNSTVNRKVAYATVPDPEATELNRAQLSWTGDQVGAVAGRQRIVLGAARAVAMWASARTSRPLTPCASTIVRPRTSA
jgi:hypothetical protein